CADVFAEGEKSVVAVQIFERRFDALINLDLLNSRIAFDIENAIVHQQVFIEFLGAADVQNGVSVAIKFSNFSERKARGWVAWEVACAKTPAVFEVELSRDLLQDLGGVVE